MRKSFFFQITCALFSSFLLSSTLAAQDESHLIGPPPSCADESSCLVLGENEAVSLGDGRELIFVGVLEDSRCPLDVYCFWAGQVKIALAVRTPDQPEAIELGLGGALNDSILSEQAELNIQLKEVWPTPVLSEEAALPYQVKLELLPLGSQPLETDENPAQAGLE